MARPGGLSCVTSTIRATGDSDSSRPTRAGPGCSFATASSSTSSERSSGGTHISAIGVLHSTWRRFAVERLPADDDKARLLRAIAGAEPVLPLVVILRIVGMAPSRHHAWHRATEV
jgi:hypothetical protein